MGILSVFRSVSLRHVLIAQQMELLFAIVPHIGVSLYWARGVRQHSRGDGEMRPYGPSLELYHPGESVSGYEAIT